MPGSRYCRMVLIAVLAYVTGCRNPAKERARSDIRPHSPPPVSAPQAAAAARPNSTPPSVVEPVAHFEPQTRPEQLAVPVSRTVEPFPIDLPTALRLADGSNLQVAFAREQIQQARARAAGAEALWLPSVRGGMGYNKHEGRIQDIAGNVFPTSRGNVWNGLGAGVPGAASPAYPGVYANFQLADALFEPLAARQAAAARQHAAEAVTNDVLLRVSLAYVELLRSAEETAIAEAALAEQRQLVELTTDYARTGLGATSDEDRAEADYAQRRNDSLRSQEAYRVASARLAQLVRLDSGVLLEPVDPAAAAVEMVPDTVPLGELVAQGLASRPELRENRHLVSHAVHKMRREQFAVLMPSIVLGVSYGGFGGGQGQTIANYGSRLDADAIAYWQLRNMGLGECAARAEARSALRQANTQHVAMLDQVAREVVEAHAQVESRRAQIDIARAGVEAAHRARARTLDRIHAGRGQPIELLPIHRSLNEARREYLRTVTDYNVAQFTLYRAIGAPGRYTVPAHGT